MTEVRPGLEGVVAFETTIAEPDRDGGALRYRGVDIEELAGRVPFEQVWGLLVDDALSPACRRRAARFAGAHGPHARRRPGRGRDARHARAADRRLRRAGARRPRTDLGVTLDFVAQSARGADLAPVPPAPRAPPRSAS